MGGRCERENMLGALRPTLIPQRLGGAVNTALIRCASTAPHSKGPNFFQVCQLLPEYGLGRKLRRCTWEDNSFWTVTRLKPSSDGEHGKAWGQLTWRGVPEEKPRRINGVLKRPWKHIATDEELSVKMKADQFQASLAAELAKLEPVDNDETASEGDA